MTKEEITARLQELAVALGRDADISGSKADLEQRLAEWEEELSDGSDGLYKDDEEPQQKNETRSERGESENRNSVDMVMVKAVVMLHVNALHGTRDKPVEFVRPGEVFRVSAVVAASMAPTRITAIATPPRMGPNSWPTVSSRSSAMPLRSRISPMSVKNGMASRVSFCMMP